MVFSKSKTISSDTTKPLSPAHGEEEHDSMGPTLNEIQIKSEKCFGSTNMDEFVANLLSADENQIPSQQNDQANVNHYPSPMQQGSFNFRTPLCKKTLDEVWFEIWKDEQDHSNNFSSPGPPQCQQTLGEMTFEDFLVKSGVVQEAPKPPLPPPHTKMDAHFGMGHMMALSYSTHHQSIRTNLSSGNGVMDYQVHPQSKEHLEGASTNIKSENGHEASSMKLEVIVERRQRKMIKNRESAARSRARKQAYTLELELELTQLKEENTKLKQTVEELERKRKKELLKRKPAPKPKRAADKLRAIRRTASVAW